MSSNGKVAGDFSFFRRAKKSFVLNKSVRKWRSKLWIRIRKFCKTFVKILVREPVVDDESKNIDDNDDDDDNRNNSMKDVRS